MPEIIRLTDKIIMENKIVKSPEVSSQEFDEKDSLELPELIDDDSNTVDVNDKESDLESFRIKWQEELCINNNRSSHGSLSTEQRNLNQSFSRLSTVSENDNKNYSSNCEYTGDKNGNVQNKESVSSEKEKEQLAHTLFNRGVEFERSGELYEAIKQYKKAMQLVPDIERKFTEKNTADVDHPDETVSYNEGSTESSLANGGLYSMLTNLLDPTAAICEPYFPVTNLSSHISSLPREILENILMWVVGSELDIRSLHTMAAVCRGFYVFTKSENLWMKACKKVWGRECSLEAINNELYCFAQCNTWRELYLSRPQPRYNGCYISKTTYFRSGECNFHDSSYQPWHVVSYYRLLRFFPGGTVLMLISSDSLQNTVGHLAQSSPSNSEVLVGTYRLEGSFLILKVIRHSKNQKAHNPFMRRRRRKENATDVGKTTLDMKFELIPSRRGAKNWFLSWREYTITSGIYGGEVVFTRMDVSRQDDFPQFTFSRVKSYMKESLEPLK